MFELKNIIFSFLLFQISLLLGFILGRITGSSPRVNVSDSLPAPRKFNFNSQETTKEINQKSLSIDDRVFVTTVASDNLQKIGSDLGQTSSVDDDIGSSVSKLAHLKKK